MKSKKLMFKQITLIVLVLCIPLMAKSQFGITPGTTPPANYGRTNPLIQGVGIGNFPFATPTNARFHINNFYCSAPTGALDGLLFRSDADENRDNKWQFFTGTTATNTTEKGVLFTSPFTNISNNVPVTNQLKLIIS